LERSAVKTRVRLAPGGLIQPERTSDAGDRGGRERVFLAEQSGEARPERWVVREEVGRLSGVALEAVDRESNRRLSPHGEGLNEREVALARRPFARQQLTELPRPRDHVRGLALDQEEDDPRSPGGQATQHLFTREQVVGRQPRPRAWRPPVGGWPSRDGPRSGGRRG